MPVSGDLSSRSRDKLHGLLVVGVAFVASMGISLWGKHVSEPEQGSPPGPPTRLGITGWPNEVDPLKTLQTARGSTRRSLLRGIVMLGVPPNGALDLSKDGTSVRYAFQSAPGKGPQPTRVPGVVPRKNWCGRQNVRIEKMGLFVEPDRAETPCGANPEEYLPEPVCTLSQIWEQARRRGVPADAAPARIEYYRSAAGPAWRFELPDGTYRFSLYGDCQRELSRHESIGSVPER